MNRRSNQDYYNEQRGSRQDENLGINVDQWQRENVHMRAGEGSSYDFHRNQGDRGWHGAQDFGSASGEAGRGDYRRRTVKNDEQREFALREGIEMQRDRSAQMRQQTERKDRMQSLNFEAYAGEANRFINLVADELDCDRDMAARVTRAVLHAVRDRIPPDDSVQFAQGLPMALKGVYFDQYDISKTPVIIRSAAEFIEYVREKDRFAAIVDFPYPQDVVQGLQAVFHVLERTMDWGQVKQIKNILPGPIVDLIDNVRTGHRSR